MSELLFDVCDPTPSTHRQSKALWAVCVFQATEDAASPAWTVLTSYLEVKGSIPCGVLQRSHAWRAEGPHACISRSKKRESSKRCISPEHNRENMLVPQVFPLPDAA